MAFMPSFVMHSLRLVLLLAMSAVLVVVVRKIPQTAYQGYLIAIAASMAGAPAYFLIHPITSHGEWIFVLVVIAVTSQSGTLPGLMAALISSLEYGLITYHQLGTISDVFLMAGLFVVSAIINGTLTKHREAAIIARAHIADELERTSETTLVALTRALDARDRDTEGHSERVAALAVRIGQEMGMTQASLNSLKLAALLHDIGKIGIPDAILHKPGPLDDKEMEQIHQHPQIGYNILRNIPFLVPSLDGILHHHEKFDGTGYPSGLIGNEIPLSARILAVVDVYDALTSHRPYRPAYSHNEGVEIIQKQTGRQFDPQVVSLLLNALPANQVN